MFLSEKMPPWERQIHQLIAVLFVYTLVPEGHLVISLRKFIIRWWSRVLPYLIVSYYDDDAELITH